MTTKKEYEAMLNRLDRLEAEYGGELPELSDPGPYGRARRLLDADAPLEDDDFDFLAALTHAD